MAAALIVGAGDATGGAIAKAFAREGYTACVNRRARNANELEALVKSIHAEGYAARAYPADARIEEEVVAMVDAIERDVGPIEVAVFTIGANVNFSILDMTSQVYRKVWEMAAFAGFLMGREAARRMVERQSGTIIFTGATASLRGGSGFSAFSGAKGALRMLAQSMARTARAVGVPFRALFGIRLGKAQQQRAGRRIGLVQPPKTETRCGAKSVRLI